MNMQPFNQIEGGVHNHNGLQINQSSFYGPVSFASHSAESQRETWLGSLHASLYYPDITARQEAIKPQHKKTFEWIFDENADLKSSGPNFIQWLRSHGGIYWIHGKAGSGKSTLMNFIAEDDRLQEALDEWGGNFEVFRGSFFFWRSGTDLQKSLQGLLRSILFQILSSCPTLVDTVLGTLYNPRISTENYHWSIRKLQQCFGRLLSQDKVKICLLVDGLDEFAGNHLDIVELLQETSEISSVKICLSSRPLPIFQSAFSKAPGLQFQDLTEGDIMAYVQDRLHVRDLERFEYEGNRSVHQNIANTIIDKACGVFIWVESVVRSVQKGYFHEDSPERLLARIQKLPPEILDLYLPMLEAVEEEYFDHQYRILEALRFNDAEMGWLYFPISSLFIQNMDDADKETPRPSRMKRSEDDAMEQKHRAKIQIEACCMGLIEVDKDGFLRYSHDTVREVLSDPETKEKLKRRVSIPEFNPACAFLKSAITLIQQRFKNGLPWAIEVWDRYSRYFLNDQNGIRAYIRMAIEAARWLERSGKPAETLILNRLDLAVSDWYQSYLHGEFDAGYLQHSALEYALRHHWSETLLSTSMSIETIKEDCENMLRFSKTLEHRMPLNFLGLAARFHLRTYVEIELYLQTARLVKTPEVKQLKGAYP